jgi:hypothetical protein
VAGVGHGKGDVVMQGKSALECSWELRVRRKKCVEEKCRVVLFREFVRDL